MKPEITVNWENIQCEKCGMCCSTECKFKKGKLCLIHPSTTGNYDVPGDRGIKCNNTPVQLFEYGGYCPPVIRALSALVPDLKIIKKKDRNGQVFVENYVEVLEIYRRVRGLK